MMRRGLIWIILVWLSCLIRPVLSVGLPTDNPPKGLIHPRLLLAESEREGFRLKMARSVRLGAGWKHVQDSAHRILNQTPLDDRKQVREGGIAKHDGQQLSQVAFVAFVNGDEKLAAKGIDMLMAACAYRGWQVPASQAVDRQASSWDAVLNIARITESVATAYDLLYPRMTDEQRATVRRALIENGIQPLMSNWDDPPAESQLQRRKSPTDYRLAACVGAAGLGTLAVLGEEPMAPDWIKLARDRLHQWLLACRDDGNEYLSNMARASQAWSFSDALFRATGENPFEELTVGHDAPLDSSAWKAIAWREDGAVKSSQMMLTDGEQSPELPLLYAALTRYKHDTTAAWLTERVVPVPRDIRELVWFDTSVLACEPKVVAPMRVFPSMGQVIMRSGWGPNTPAAAIAFRKAGRNLGDGSFDLFGGGHPTFVDSGTKTRDRSAFDSRASELIAPNLVVVDDQPQKQADGQLLAAVGTSRLTAASVQLAAAYPEALKSWTRDLLMVPGGLAIVLDRLEGKGKHRFDYVLHPYRPFRTPYPIASPGEMLIGAGDHPTRAALYSEASFSVSLRDGYNLTTPCKYLRFDSPEPSQNRTYLMVCQWPSPGAIKQRPVDVSAVGVGRWQVRRVGEDWRLMIRTGEDADTKNAEEARLAAVWDQGEKSHERHALVLAARRLGVDNNELMRATQPVSAAIEFGRPLWAHFWATAPTRVALTVEPEINHVFLNGAPIELVRRGKTICFDLPPGESTLLASELSKFIPRPASVVSDDLLSVSPALGVRQRVADPRP